MSSIRDLLGFHKLTTLMVASLTIGATTCTHADLLVSGASTDDLKRYDQTTGAFIDKSSHGAVSSMLGRIDSELFRVEQ